MSGHTPRWYMLNKVDMATLCHDQRDAETLVVQCDVEWPNMAPHKAVQIIDATAYTELLAECKATLQELGHLADGEQCTLIRLKRAVEKATGEKL